MLVKKGLFTLLPHETTPTYYNHARLMLTAPGAEFGKSVMLVKKGLFQSPSSFLVALKSPAILILNWLRDRL